MECLFYSFQQLPSFDEEEEEEEKTSKSSTNERHSGERKRDEEGDQQKNDNCSVRLIQHGNFLIFCFFLLVFLSLPRSFPFFSSSCYRSNSSSSRSIHSPTKLYRSKNDSNLDRRLCHLP
jgi:hypothetical protein